MPLRIERYLVDNAALRPAKIAIVAGSRRLTYAEMHRLSDSLAAALSANGVRRNDRVLVFMDNCWEMTVAIFAILKAGATFSPINPSTKLDKLAYILSDSEPAAIFTLAKLSPLVAEAKQAANVSSLPVISTRIANGTLPDGTVDFETCVNHEVILRGHGGVDVDLAMLIYTSGSTGRPKGVMMTHRNVDAAAESITTYLQSVADDVILNVLPLAFDYGLYQLIMAIRLGATLVLEKSFTYPQAIFERIVDENVTGFPLVPTMAAMILQMRDIRPGFLPSLRYITNTAAALPPPHIARLRELFPGVSLYSMYGLTECKRCTYLPPSELDSRPDSVGIAIPNTEAFVLDDEGNPAPPGVPGELVIRGPHVMAGYWRNPQASQQMLRPGKNPWEKLLYTGDLFRTDADGFLYFVGRKDDIIKTRGEKVAPKEVEAALHSHPGIAEAVVIGVPDPILGNAIGAMVVRSDPTLREQDVIRYCASQLEDFMVPKIIEFRTELPKTDTGKVSRRLAAETVEIAQ